MAGRATQGVIVMRFKEEGDHVISMALTDREQDAEKERAMSKKKEMYAPLTRWQYFTKTLYHDPSKTQEFEYDGVIYLKSRSCRTSRSATPGSTGAAAGAVRHVPDGHQVQNIVVIALGMVVIVAGELFRMSRLPKDIKAHLTDSGRRKL